MKRLAVLIGVAFLVMVMGSVAQAVPTLGVASGTYIGGTSSDPSCGTYIQCFSGTYSSTDGWALGSSPATITVFTNESADIWLLTTGPVTASVSGGSISGSLVDLSTLSPTPYPTSGDHWDGYVTPYYGIDLGIANTANGWAELNNPAMNPDQFYGLQLTLTYGTLPLGDGQYFFAVADDNGIAGLQAEGQGTKGGADSFSPKTTSSHPGQVPEPSTLLLLGGGILGLGIFGRKKFKK